MRHLEQQRAEGAITLAIGEPLDLGRRLVLAVEARLVRVRPVAGGWATDDRYWVSMAGGSPRGYAYRRSLDHPAAAQAVWEGQEIAPSRAAIEATMAPLDGDRLDEVEAMADQVVEDLLSQCRPDVDHAAGRGGTSGQRRRCRRLEDLQGGQGRSATPDCCVWRSW